MQILITMPVYEDWDSAIELCQKIDLVFREEKSVRVSVLLIDDGSTISNRPCKMPFRPGAIENISILVLRRNLGHQRAIAIALAHIQEHWSGDAVVVMDADGEDRPEDIPGLVQAMRKAERPTAVFAERGRRLENAAFRICYNCYRICTSSSPAVISGSATSASYRGRISIPLSCFPSCGTTTQQRLLSHVCPMFECALIAQSG